VEPDDVFDEIDWYPESKPERPRPISIREIDGKPWVDLQEFQLRDIPHQLESHALRIGQLDANRIPSPPQLIGIHIDRADRADLFGWATSDIVMMNRKAIPPLAVIHLQSQVFDRERLSSEQFPFGQSRYRVLPRSFAIRHIQGLAESWTEGLPRGWPQIAAIEQNLRKHYQLDPEARPDENCICPVAEFLFCSRRGPDYQFATAAAVMLRSLGYSARVVSGFYADPDRYDVRSRQTPIFGPRLV